MTSPQQCHVHAPISSALLDKESTSHFDTMPDEKCLHLRQQHVPRKTSNVPRKTYTMNVNGCVGTAHLFWPMPCLVSQPWQPQAWQPGSCCCRPRRIFCLCSTATSHALYVYHSICDIWLCIMTILLTRCTSHSVCIWPCCFCIRPCRIWPCRIWPCCIWPCCVWPCYICPNALRPCCT